MARSIWMESFSNYLQLEIVRNEYPQLHIVSLCQPQETGYHHQKFELVTPQEKKESIIRLLVSITKKQNAEG